MKEREGGRKEVERKEVRESKREGEKKRVKGTEAGRGGKKMCNKADQTAEMQIN